MIFWEYSNDTLTLFYKKNQNNIFQRSRRRFRKNSDEWTNCVYQNDITSFKSIKSKGIKLLKFFMKLFRIGELLSYFIIAILG